MPVYPALFRSGQADHKFKDSMGYRTRTCYKARLYRKTSKQTKEKSPLAHDHDLRSGTLKSEDDSKGRGTNDSTATSENNPSAH